MGNLAINVAHTGSPSKSFNLDAKEIKISHQRSPILAPMPASDPLLIDLGQWKSTITITGICNFSGTNQTDTGGTTIADRDDLEDMVNPGITTPWYNEDITLTDSTNGGNATYIVKISSLTLEKTGANTWYNFTLTCVGYFSG
jgi:hypothetical protein